MTYDELLQVGYKRGFVQWTRSKRIEKLRIAVTTSQGHRKGELVVLVSTLMPGSKEHPIFRPQREPHDFLCTELQRSTPIRIGDIFR